MNVPLRILNRPLNDANAITRERIVQFLRRQNFSAFRNVEVEASDGIVTLRGKTRSFYHKQLALNHSRCVLGTYKLVDEIVVQKVNQCHLSNRVRLAD